MTFNCISVNISKEKHVNSILLENVALVNYKLAIYGKILQEAILKSMSNDVSKNWITH